MNTAIFAGLALALPAAAPPHTYVFGRASFVTGGSPVAIARGDLDGDGIPDLVTANNADDTVSVLRGAAGGDFQPHVDYAAGAEPNALALGDLDGDGALDVVVVAQNCVSGTCGGGSVSVLLGHGDGTFGAAVSYPTNTNPQSLTIGDFDEDGIPDLAVVNAVTIITQGPGTVSILLGNGDGTFQPGTEFPAGRGPGAIVAADLDGDGHLDLALTDYIPINVVSAVAVLRGNGNGTFQSLVALRTANGPVRIVAADLDGDGDLDLATADLGGNAVSILRNSGNGTFQPHVEYPAGFGPKAIAVADLDHDGRLDLVLTTFTFVTGGGSVVVLPGNGDGTFQPFREYVTGPIGPAILAWDVDGDGKQDLAVPDLSQHVSVLLGNGDGTLAGPATCAAGGGPVSIAAADLDLDQRTDLMVANQVDGTFSVFLGNGDGTFQPRADHPAGATPTAILATRLNHDGKIDLAIADGNPNTLSILLGKGDGTFRPRRAFDTAADPESVVDGDFDGDGKADLVVAARGVNAISILRGIGDGTFLSRTDFGAGPGPVSVTRADFNLDGWLDVAVADANTPWYGPGKVSILLGNGDGTFGAPLLHDAGVEADAVAAGDFDGDGKPDLAVATNLDVFGSVAILMGNGDGTLQAQIGYSAGRIAVFVKVGDFNGDGKPDLAVVNQGSNTVTILKGRGDGTFELQANYATGLGPSSLATGDFDGDGRLDMAVTNLVGSLSVFVSEP
jgi:hypothetical protein